jgi:hypothetical protein
MAVIGSAMAAFLHEGIGHGVTAWLLGDGPTELTSNHLSSARDSPLVLAGGTVVNAIAGTVALVVSRRLGDRTNTRYFLWLLGALNLLPAAGYFLFSGIGGLGDWYEMVKNSPHQGMWRIAMTVFGAAFTLVAVRVLAVGVRPFVFTPATYNTVGRLPYFAACSFSCAAGALDPLGLKLLLMSTIPAAFGGSSGLLWADSLMPKTYSGRLLTVQRSVRWWIAALAIGIPYIAVLGRGIQFGPQP